MALWTFANSLRRTAGLFRRRETAIVDRNSIRIGRGCALTWAKIRLCRR